VTYPYGFEYVIASQYNAELKLNQSYTELPPPFPSRGRVSMGENVFAMRQKTL